MTANASDAAAASSAGSFTRLTELFLSKVENGLGVKNWLFRLYSG